MIGIFLIYYLGKQFYELAENYNKNKWGFAILGVVFYYLGTMLFGVLLGVWAGFTNNIDVFESSDILLGLMGIPLGLLCAWLFYFLLKKNWSKININYSDNELLDSNLD